jgi:hypothetical protein
MSLSRLCEISYLNGVRAFNFPKQMSNSVCSMLSHIERGTRTTLKCVKEFRLSWIPYKLPHSYTNFKNKEFTSLYCPSKSTLIPACRLLKCNTPVLLPWTYILYENVTFTSLRHSNLTNFLIFEHTQDMQLPLLLIITIIETLALVVYGRLCEVLRLRHADGAIAKLSDFGP